MRHKLTTILLALIVGMSTMALSACSDDGPAENAGESIDNAGDSIQDGASDAADSVGDATEDAGDSMNN